MHNKEVNEAGGEGEREGWKEMRSGEGGDHIGPCRFWVSLSEEGSLGAGEGSKKNRDMYNMLRGPFWLLCQH